MSRQDFPTRRPGEALDYDYDGMAIRACANRFDGGEIGEIFINAGKPDSAAYYVAQEAAIIFSIARRYGAPMSEIRAALPKLASGKPAGLVGVFLKMVEAASA